MSNVYQWDRHAHLILLRINKEIQALEGEIQKLERHTGCDAQKLLEYYRAWQVNREALNRICCEVLVREHLIRVMFQKGYGANLSLAQVLRPLGRKDLPSLSSRIAKLFFNKTAYLKSIIDIPPEKISKYDTQYIIIELEKKLGIDGLASAQNLSVREVWEKEKDESSPFHSYILEKLYLKSAECSRSIMVGPAIPELSAIQVKIVQKLALSNLRMLFCIGRDAASFPIKFDFDSLQVIHKLLTQGTDQNVIWKGGTIREFDFPDRDGVSIQNEALKRELTLLSDFPSHYNSTDEFISLLARFYHLLIAIHPFGDSNGRTAKTFVNLCLLQNGLPPVSFDREEEILRCLRYGGSSEDMKQYFEWGLKCSLDEYRREKTKVCAWGKSYSLMFDSGVYFYITRDALPQLRVNLKILLVDKNDLRYMGLKEMHRVVFTDEKFLKDITLRYGFKFYGDSDWKENCDITAYSLEEISISPDGIRTFDLNAVIHLEEHQSGYDVLGISIVSLSSGNTFNKRGENYTCALK